MSIFDSFFNNKTLLRLFYCALTIILPLFFYFCLNKNDNISKKNILIISSIIFILPAFRYTSIWATDLITSLIFQISIFFYLKWNENKSNDLNKEIIFQIIFLATYCRQYFAVFFIIFSVFILKLKIKKLCQFIFNMCLYFFTSPLLHIFFLINSYSYISINSVKVFLLGNSSMMSISFANIFNKFTLQK